MTELVQHHIKYKELDGIDEITLMTASEHKKLHIALKKQGRSKIPVNVILAANARTPKRKKSLNIYKRVAMKRINFCHQVGTNVQLFERVVYNINSGNVFISTGFMINGNGYLPTITEDN